MSQFIEQNIQGWWRHSTYYIFVDIHSSNVHHIMSPISIHRNIQSWIYSPEQFGIIVNQFHRTFFHLSICHIWLFTFQHWLQKEIHHTFPDAVWEREYFAWSCNISIDASEISHGRLSLKLSSKRFSSNRTYHKYEPIICHRNIFRFSQSFFGTVSFIRSFAFIIVHRALNIVSVALWNSSLK